MMEQQMGNLYTAVELNDRRIQQAVNQKMTQCKHEIDKLRKELDELKKNNELEMDKLKAHIAQLEGPLTTTTMELNRYRKRWGADLAAIDRKREEDRQRAMEACKQLAMEMAIKYNMPLLNVNRDNEDEGKSQFLVSMPLELHCELFCCLRLFEQRRLIWQSNMKTFGQGDVIGCGLEIEIGVRIQSHRRGQMPNQNCVLRAYSPSNHFHTNGSQMNSLLRQDQ